MTVFGLYFFFFPRPLLSLFPQTNSGTYFALLGYPTIVGSEMTGMLKSFTTFKPPWISTSKIRDTPHFVGNYYI
jgi:hypothetical protein